MVPIDWWKQLPCCKAIQIFKRYFLNLKLFFFRLDDSRNYGDKYQRQCESINYAASMLIEQYKLHGTTQVSMRSNICDYDGAHGDYLVENGM